MKTKTTIWKAENHLKTKEEREAYLNAAFEDGDASVIAAALGDIAQNWREVSDTPRHFF